MGTTRADSRGASEIRPIEIAFDELDRADGSARFAFGATSSLTSFSGPMEVRLQKDQATKATLEVVHRPLEGIGATPSRALESALSSLLPPLLNLGQHPRSLVQLIIQSLSPTKLPSSAHRTPIIAHPSQRTWPATEGEDEDGDTESEVGVDEEKSSPMTSISFASRASGINATALAIMVASSLQLKAIPVAISLALLPSTYDKGSSTLVVDPTMEEEAKAIARFGFGWAIGHGLGGSAPSAGGMDVDDDVDGLEMELVWVDSEGSTSRAEFEEALQLSKVGVASVWRSMRESAGQHIARTSR